MTNIFKNAYFGKAYKTQDDRRALYQRNFLSKYIEPSDGREHYISLHTVMTEQHIWQVDDEGKREDLRRMSSNFDIVSEWEEEINEEKLDELAEEYFLNTYNNGVKDPNLEIINEKKFAVADFKAGCRKILEIVKYRSSI